MVRVFVSSTFQDIQAERDELAKRIFPQLRRLCEERGVAWGEVDLRWGITQEEAEQGRVLPICLAEIKNCEPFFIGLLGNRYGWIPGSLPPDLLEQHPWMGDYTERSVTEIEMRYALKLFPAPNGHCFFYIHRPQSATDIGSVPASSSPTTESVRLDRLKQFVRASGYPVRDYTTPEEAGAFVLVDFTALLDELYPPSNRLSETECEHQEQEIFLSRRLEFYHGRGDHFEELDRHARKSSPPLVITGEPGTGKTALLANWLEWRHGRNDPPLIRSFRSRWVRLGRALAAWSWQHKPSSQEQVFAYFIGATPQSTDLGGLLRCVLRDFKSEFHLDQEVPEAWADLQAAFPEWLETVSAKRRIVLVLDGLDHLEERGSAHGLSWLPKEFPRSVCLIVSTAGGATLRACEEREWPQLTVRPLRRVQVASLTDKYLKGCGKKLSRPDRALLLRAKAARAPGFLLALLEELRLFGRHEEVRQQITRCLEAPTLEALYGLFLARLEVDYEAKRAGLVRETLSLISASRLGLEESELLDLLGNEERLPHHLWSPLYLALQFVLGNQSGRLNFFNGSFRRAVETRYLGGEALKQSAHRRLVDFYWHQPWSEDKVDLLPAQCAAAGDWGRLATLLEDPEFVQRAWPARSAQVLLYWDLVESRTPGRLAQAIQTLVQRPNLGSHLRLILAEVLIQKRHFTEASDLHRRIETVARSQKDARTLQRVLAQMAMVSQQLGQHQSALRQLWEERRLCEELADTLALAANLGNQAVILRLQGQLDRALEYHRSEEQLCRQLRDWRGLAHCLGNQGLIYCDRADWPVAQKAFAEQEELCRRVSDYSALQKCWGNQAVAFMRAGDGTRAAVCLSNQENLCRRFHDLAGLQICLGNQAALAELAGDFDRAISLLEEKEQLCAETSDPASQVRAVFQQAALFSKLGQFQHARSLLSKAEELLERTGSEALLKECIALIETIELRLKNLD